MSKRPPKRDPIAAYKREVTAVRRIGEGHKCACGEVRPEALIAGSNPLICAECDRKRNGMKTEDDHHVAAAANDPTTIPVPVNDHRAELSAAQADWPKRTLENPDGSPVLARAACIRGNVDTMIYLAEKLLIPSAEILEVLDEHLVQERGPRYWVGTKLERFQRKPKPDDQA
jgi:hypothetical protein